MRDARQTRNNRNRLLKLAVLTLISTLLPSWAQSADKTAPITAEEIVQKNIAARGGLEAWQAVESFTMAGRIYTGTAEEEKLNFLLDVKRPRKARIEVQFRGQKAVQVFDGKTAWKLAPFLQKYDEQVDSSQSPNLGSAGLDLGGPLMDYDAKGIFVDLQGIESVDGHDAYKLRLTMKDGGVRHMWVDTQTFLELKVDSNPRIVSGRLRAVTTYYRDYRPVQGLMIPHLFETVVDGVRQTERVTIDSVLVNPKLDDNLFTPE